MFGTLVPIDTSTRGIVRNRIPSGFLECAVKNWNIVSAYKQCKPFLSQFPTP